MDTLSGSRFGLSPPLPAWCARLALPNKRNLGGAGARGCSVNCYTDWFRSERRAFRGSLNYEYASRSKRKSRWPEAHARSAASTHSTPAPSPPAWRRPPEVSVTTGTTPSPSIIRSSLNLPVLFDHSSTAFRDDYVPSRSFLVAFIYPDGSWKTAVLSQRRGCWVPGPIQSLGLVQPASACTAVHASFGCWQFWADVGCRAVQKQLRIEGEDRTAAPEEAHADAGVHDGPPRVREALDDAHEHPN